MDGKGLVGRVVSTPAALTSGMLFNVLCGVILCCLMLGYQSLDVFFPWVLGRAHRGAAGVAVTLRWRWAISI